jgi:hypothetical protein
MLMLTPMPISAATIQDKARGQSTGCGASQENGSYSCGRKLVGAGFCYSSSGCSSSRWIESAVAGKKGVDSSGKL